MRSIRELGQSMLVAALFLGAGGIIGCSTSNVSSLSIPLQYSSHAVAGSVGSFTLPAHPAKLYIAPVMDERTNRGVTNMGGNSTATQTSTVASTVASSDTVSNNRRDAIGANEENAGKTIPIYASQGTPAQYVHDAVVSQLKADGIMVVDSPEDADRVLHLTLVKFWAVEDPSYHAAVQVTGTITDERGKAAYWNGGAGGDDATFGKSLSVENYTQVLSNSVSKLTSNLLMRPEFVKALSAD